jgi:hypothetical protein
MRLNTIALSAGVMLLAHAANAQTPAPELDACKASGLIALKQHTPSIKAVTIDPDTVSISKTDTMIEQTRVRTVILGLATIDTARKEKPNQFVCLIGDKGKVLLTFFTQK